MFRLSQGFLVHKCLQLTCDTTSVKSFCSAN